MLLLCKITTVTTLLHFSELNFHALQHKSKIFSIDYMYAIHGTKSGVSHSILETGWATRFDFGLIR